MNLNLLQGSGTKRVEAEALSRVDNGHLTRVSQDGALACCVRNLRRGRTDNGDHGGRVNDAALCLAVFPERANSMLGAVPHTLDVDVHGQVPNVVGAFFGIAILGVHDAGVVEHDINAAPAIDYGDSSLDLVLFGDIDYFYVDFALDGGDNALDLGQGLFKGCGVDICHEDGGTLLQEQNGGLEADAAAGKCQCLFTIWNVQVLMGA